MKKVCTKCGVEKSSSAFGYYKNSKDKLQSYCKECRKQNRKDNNTDQKYYLKNKTIINTKHSNYYKDNKTIIKARTKEYYNNNKEYYKEYNDNYRVQNLESIKNQQSISRDTEHYRELKRLSEAKYRALKISTSDGTVTIESTYNMLDQQCGMCPNCLVNISNRNSRHLDHIKPISKGGVHTLNNLQWLCIKCNLVKSDKY